ncbi:MAG: radical SAM protein [Lachnospiraceae bacterium]|jgi:sulfatase maturation enzyme AslB (radical SAM superfamily)|nr:radical SAM protein [Lachnospiraceae bacterium]
MSMKLLHEGDKNVIKLIETKEISPSTHYRISNYTFVTYNGPRHLIRQTLSGRVLELDNQEWERFLRLTEHALTGEQITASGLESLVPMRILVPTESDEFEQYKITMTVLRTLAKKNTGIQSYTILPTTGCNARCVYCYEEGIPVRHMSLETAQAVVDFICRMKPKGDDPIKLHWFGGEPLLGSKVISYICKSLEEKEIPFYSKIVTNATLLTKQLAHEAKELWHVKHVQVSVDGVRMDYEQRKAYVNPAMHNYDAMLQAIHILLGEGIPVTLRCNYDGENLPRLKEFLAQISSEFQNSEYLFFYFHMLYQNRHSPASIDLQKQICEIQDYRNQLGLPGSKEVARDFAFRVNYCMADSLTGDITIDPEGNLYQCENIQAFPIIGHISDPEFHLKTENWLKKIDPQCKTCCFLPKCTPFYKIACPDYFDYCQAINSIELEHSLNQLKSGM